VFALDWFSGGPPLLRQRSRINIASRALRVVKAACRRPTPINPPAASTVSRLSDKSISTRSRVSSRSLICITVIARHPERLDDSLSQ
jgi:hypothetical protein